MPLVRYFLFVGGVLLTLVFILDAWLTELPVMERSHANSPVIRIHSDRKWPERIVFDTTLPAIAPAQTAIVEDRVPSPATVTDVARKGEGTGGICVDAAIRCEAAGIIRPRKAGTDAATATQNREAARDAAFALRRAATAVWLVWQHHLVMTPAILLRARGAMAKVQISRENLCTKKPRHGAPGL